MIQHEITLRYIEVSAEGLSDEQRMVAEAARKASYRSYAPYSHFHVGAAVLLSNGEVVTGSNQENAAYPSGLCAERTAAFYAGSRYPEASFKILAIAARTAGSDNVEKNGISEPAESPIDDEPITSTPVTPCGACRQSLLEYEKRSGRPVEVILVGRERCLILPSIASTLPLSFSDF